MPGNDIHGGFATHIVVPAHGLCAVDEARLAAAGIELADLSVIADAVTTPYQAVVQAGVAAGDLVIVNGVGGVGGYAAQIATRVRRRGGRDRRRATTSSRPWPGQGAALDPECAADDAARSQGGDSGIRQGARPAAERMDHLRMLRHPRRPGDGIQPAQSRRDARRRRLHHGQGRGPAVEPDGLPRPRDRQLGLPAGALSAGARTGAQRPRQGRAVRREASVERDQPCVRGRPCRRAQAARRSRSQHIEEHDHDRGSRSQRHRRQA